MHFPDLKNKRVFITGASSGIGSACVEIFAEQGAVIGLHYFQSEKEAKQLKLRIEKQTKCDLFQADLTDSAQIQPLVENFTKKAGGLDILVNNAGGLLKRMSVAEADAEYYDRLYQLNLRSAFLVTRAASPFLQKSGGSIVNIGSVAGHSGGGPGAGFYSSLKAALATATIAMAKEFAPHGIRVNSVLPGFIDTPFHDGVTSAAQKAEYLHTIPLGRLGTAADVARTVLFLSSEAASYITGEYLAVNGGMLMRA